MPTRPAGYRVTRSTFPGSVSISRQCFLESTVRRISRIGFIPSCLISPSEFLRPPSLLLLSEPPSCQGFVPLRGITDGVHCREASRLPRRSVRRFSQPLDGFRPPSASRVYCIPQPRPGLSPFRGFSRSTAAPTRRRFVPPCRCHPSAHRRTGCHPRMIRLRGVAPWTDAFLRVGGWPSLRSLPSSVSSSFRFSLPAVDPVSRGLHS